MSLIDRNKLWNEIAKIRINTADPMKMFGEALTLIINAEDEDAIPVKWIRDRYNKIYERYVDYQHPADKEALDTYKELLEQWDTRHDS